MRITTLYDITNNGITFTFNDTPAVNASGDYIKTPYETTVTPSGNYGSSMLLTGGQPLIPPNPPSTLGGYSYNTIGGNAIRYENIHTINDTLNLYPYKSFMYF